MQIIKGNEKIAEILFDTAFLIQLLVMIVGYSAWDMPYRGYLLHFSFGLFCIKILMTEYTKVEWSLGILAAILGSISYFYTREEYVISVVVLIFSAKSSSVKKLLKVTALAVFFAILIIPVLSILGYGHPLFNTYDYGRGGLETRWGFGFGHANNFHGTIWYILCLLILFYHEKLKSIHYGLLTIMNLLCFYFTVSKAGLLCTQIVILAGWLLPKLKGLTKNRFFYIAGMICLVFVQGISFLSVILDIQDSAILKVFDRLLTGRIRLAKELVPIECWKILSCGGDTQYVDNGWVTVFVNYGWIIGISFFAFHIVLLYLLWKKECMLQYIILLTSVLYIFMESSYCLNTVYLLSNVSYLIAMLVINKEKENESIDCK